MHGIVDGDHQGGQRKRFFQKTVPFATHVCLPLFLVVVGTAEENRKGRILPAQLIGQIEPVLFAENDATEQEVEFSLLLFVEFQASWTLPAVCS